MEATTPNNSTKTSIEYVEADLQQVLQYFVNAYKLQEGKIISHQAFVDTSKGKVVFRLFVEKPIAPGEGRA